MLIAFGMRFVLLTDRQREEEKETERDKKPHAMLNNIFFY